MSQSFAYYTDITFQIITSQLVTLQNLGIILFDVESNGYLSSCKGFSISRPMAVKGYLGAKFQDVIDVNYNEIALICVDKDCSYIRLSQ